MVDQAGLPNKTWSVLCQRLLHLQAGFIESAESLPVEKRESSGVCGDWSPREVVAHISGWDAEVLRQFELFNSGFTGEVEHDIESFNQQSVASRGSLDWEETLEELRQIHRCYPAALETVGEIHRASNSQYEEWLQVLIEHYEHHTEQLQRWL